MTLRCSAHSTPVPPTGTRSNGMAETAIEHADAAGETEHVARLVLDADAAGLGERPGRDGSGLDGAASTTARRSPTPRPSPRTAP